DAGRLVVLVVPAGVADLRRGLHHDLPVIRRVGQRLLIPGHPGREHGLPERAADLAVAGATEDPAVLQHQRRRDVCALHQRFTLPSRAVTRPCSRVAITRPGSSMPSYGVLSATLASSAPRTVQL